MTYSVGSRATLSHGTSNRVSRMPSGSKIRWARNVSNGWPTARSIITPSTSAPVLYSQRSPGWDSSGSEPRRRVPSAWAGGGGGAGRALAKFQRAGGVGRRDRAGLGRHDAQAHGEGEQVPQGDRAV